MQAEGAAGPGIGAAQKGSGILALQLALRALHLHKLQGSPKKASFLNYNPDVDFYVILVFVLV